MERRIIGAGLLAGLVAGLVGFGFARRFIEPLVAEAIDYEELRSHAEEHLHGGAHGHEHGELFSRSIQENVGAGIGTVVFTVAIGALFAVVYTVAWAYLGRYRPSTDPRLAAVAQGAVAFVAVIGVPFFVYPPNPPAVGEADTIAERSSAYLTITVVSVVAAVLATAAALWLAPRIGGLVAGLGSTVLYLAVVTVTAALLPTFAEVPGPLMDGDVIVAPGFPGQVIADYRIYAVAAQVLMFVVLTAVFTGLVHRMMRPVDAPDREPVAV